MSKTSTSMDAHVARPTDRLDEVILFYRDGLGLDVIDSFEDRDGFDGVSLRASGDATLRFQQARTPGALVNGEKGPITLGAGSEHRWTRTVEHMVDCGFAPSAISASLRTAEFRDPDGVTVVFQHT